MCLDAYTVTKFTQLIQLWKVDMKLDEAALSA